MTLTDQILSDFVIVKSIYNFYLDDQIHLVVIRSHRCQ